MIIDSHAHLNLFTEQKISLKQRVLDLKRLRKQAGIDKTIIFSTIPAVSKDVLTTEDAIRICKKKEGIFVVAGISVGHDRKELDNIKELLEQKQIVGVKLYPGYEPFCPADERCSDIYDLCEEFDVPIIFHSGDTFRTGAGVKYSHPIHIDELAVKRPNLKIVIAHLGNPWLIDTMEMLYRHPNVYADISELVWSKFDAFFQKYYNDQIVLILKWSGQNKLLFGTDWPCNDPEFYESYMKNQVEFVNKLKISKEDKEKIFHLNAEKVFRI
jgi:uncharacterized protein